LATDCGCWGGSEFDDMSRLIVATRGGNRLDSCVLGGDCCFYYYLELLLFLSDFEALLLDEEEEEESPNHFLNIDILLLFTLLNYITSLF
jgi:hypothetical protein